MAWINTNWLFMAILLLLTRPGRDIYPLAWIMAGAWVVPCFFWAMDDLQIPVGIHPIVPALATVAICALCLRPSQNFAGLAVALGAAGLLNGCFDIQQTSLERPASDVANLIGLLPRLRRRPRPRLRRRFSPGDRMPEISGLSAGLGAEDLRRPGDSRADLTVDPVARFQKYGSRSFAFLTRRVNSYEPVAPATGVVPVRDPPPDGAADELCLT